MRFSKIFSRAPSRLSFLGSLLVTLRQSMKTVLQGHVEVIRAHQKRLIDIVESESILESLLGSREKVNEFNELHFAKHPVVYRNNDTTKINEMLYDLDVKTMLENTASEQIHVWLKQMSEETLESITVGDASQALKLYKAGISK